MSGVNRTRMAATPIGLLPEFKGHESVYGAAEKIRAQLATLYLIGGVAIKLTASVGTAVYPVEGNQLDDLIQTSDRAMYRSKAQLRSRHAGDSFSREAL